MKNQGHILKLLLAYFFFLVSCGDAEIAPKEYPLVSTQQVNKSTKGTELVAEITSLGSTSISQFGFVWYKGVSAIIDSTNLFVKEIETAPRVGRFSVVIESDLQDGISYTARAFIKTEKNIVFGQPISFEGESSNKAVITDFFPKSGDAGDTVTIIGSNFSVSKSRTRVFIGSDLATIISVDFQEIKFILPQKLSNSGEVIIKLQSGESLLQADDLFLIKGHQILDFNPKMGIVGETEVIIEGNGFLETGNSVKVGIYNAAILSESTTQIKIRLPYTMKVGEEYMEVVVNERAASSTDKFLIKSRWKRLKDFPGTPRANPFVARIEDKLFMFGGELNRYSEKVWAYDINQDTWEQIPTSIPETLVSTKIGFNIGKTIYLGDLDGYYWSFDSETLQWQEIGRSKRLRDPIIYSTNYLGYAFGGRGNEGIFQYSPIDGWSRLGDFPNTLRLISDYDSQLNADGQIYIIDNVSNCCLTTTYNLLRFDPNNPDFFELIGRVPFQNKNFDAITFALDDLYVGEGSISHESEFLKYNLETQVWQRIENFQGGKRIRGSISFTYQDKGYAGFGYDENGKMTVDLWVYDPSIN